MKAPELCALLRHSVSERFECSPAPIDGVRIRTPLLLPDGDVVDVFVVENGDGFVVTDFGDAVGWLRNQSISGKLTWNQSNLLKDLCMTLDVNWERGQLTHQVVSPDELRDAVQRVAQAVLRTSDLWFTFRAREMESVSDEVDDWLRLREIPFERSVRMVGHSGKDWTVDFKTTSPSHTTLVFLLSTGTRGAANNIAYRVFSGCSDLAQTDLTSGPQKFVSLFDDSVDVWRSEYFALLETVSEIALWSNPDQFEDILKTPSASK